MIAVGLADEIHIGIMPVLLCGGQRLFEQLDVEPIILEKIGTSAHDVELNE